MEGAHLYLPPPLFEWGITNFMWRFWLVEYLTMGTMCFIAAFIGVGTWTWFCAAWRRFGRIHDVPSSKMSLNLHEINHDSSGYTSMIEHFVNNWLCWCGSLSRVQQFNVLMLFVIAGTIMIKMLRQVLQ